MSGKKNAPSDEVEAAWIREMASILKETDLTEIEMEREGLRIRVARAINQTFSAMPPQVTSAPAGPTSPAPETPAGIDAADPANLPGAVTSPMVGTAYRSPAPGAKPFVENGDRVTEGQTLLIVEAMKTMNPITSPRNGVVAEFLVTDAQPVEFGEALVIVN